MSECPCIDDIDPDFAPEHTNDSHKWLFNYPGKMRPDDADLKMGLTAEIYTNPAVNKKPKEGRRKKLLEIFYRKLFSEEVIRQLDSNDPVIEKYETDYSGNFKDPREMPLPGETLSESEKSQANKEDCGKSASDLSSSEKLIEKWPLYGSRPLSWYAQKQRKMDFGITTTISKPIEENYDGKEY